MRDVWRVDDCGYDGYNISGPYEEAEARRRFPNDMLVRFLQLEPEPFYTYKDEPLDAAADPVDRVPELLPDHRAAEHEAGEEDAGGGEAGEAS